jgi:adenylate kinase
VKRLTGRRTCRGCNYNAPHRVRSSQEPGVCDKCGGELYQRDDDREATIRSRLKTNHDQTSPLIEYYSKQGVVRTISGTGSMEQVQEAIRKAIEHSAKLLWRRMSSRPRV